MKLALHAIGFFAAAGATSAFAQSFIGNATPSVGQSGVFAYWNFNSLSISTASVPGSGGVPTSIAADFGTGSLSLSGWGGAVDDFAGSTINAQSSDASGPSLSLTGGVSSVTANNTYIQFSFSMTNLASLDIDFATRGTSTGFDSSQWSYSTNGTDFTGFGTSTATRSTTFAAASPTSVALNLVDNAPSVFVRYLLSGASSFGGNNRVDNVTLSATYTPVPEPSSFAALAGLGALGFCATRRPRR